MGEGQGEAQQTKAPASKSGPEFNLQFPYGRGGELTPHPALQSSHAHYGTLAPFHNKSANVILKLLKRGKNLHTNIHRNFI